MKATRYSASPATLFKSVRTQYKHQKGNISKIRCTFSENLYIGKKMSQDLLRHRFLKIAFLHCSEHRLFLKLPGSSLCRLSLVLILLPSPTKPDSDDALMRIIVSHGLWKATRYSASPATLFKSVRTQYKQQKGNISKIRCTFSENLQIGKKNEPSLVLCFGLFE